VTWVTQMRVGVMIPGLPANPLPHSLPTCPKTAVSFLREDVLRRLKHNMCR